MRALSKYLRGAIAVAVGLCVIPAASMARSAPAAGLASVAKHVAAAPATVTHVAGSLAAKASPVKASPVARKAPPKPPPAIPAPTPTRPLSNAATHAAAPAASVVKQGTTQAANVAAGASSHLPPAVHRAAATANATVHQATATATHAVSSGTGSIRQVGASGSGHVRQIAGAGVATLKRTTAAVTSTSSRAIGVVDSKLRSGVKAAKAAVSQIGQASHLHPTPGRSPQGSTSSRGRSAGQQSAPGTPSRAPGLTAPWQLGDQFGHPGDDLTTQQGPGARGARSQGTPFGAQRTTSSNAASLSAPGARGLYGTPGSHGTTNGPEPGAVSTPQPLAGAGAGQSSTAGAASAAGGPAGALLVSILILVAVITGRRLLAGADVIPPAPLLLSGARPD